jgi:hypothetical protein
MTITDTIGLHERRGVLTYRVGDEHRTFDGWVHRSINGRGIVARRYRGSNRWLIANIENVVDFVEASR